MSINANPESTWGMSAEQKEAWANEYAPKPEPVVEEEPVEVRPEDNTNPESTWGATPENKIAWAEKNTDDWDPDNPVSHPTEVGLHDENAIQAPAQTTLDAGPVVSRDDRDPEYTPIYAPAEDSDQDYTAPTAPVIDEVAPIMGPGDVSHPNDTSDVPMGDTNPAAGETGGGANQGLTFEEGMQVDKTDAPTETDAPADETNSTPDAPVLADPDFTPPSVDTVDGQENTANESSTTGGADASQ